MCDPFSCFQGLADDGAKLHIYDPKVTKEQIIKDLSTPKFEWDHPSHSAFAQQSAAASVTHHTDVYAACKSAHAIAVLTEWDEFKTLDFEKVYEGMNEELVAKQNELEAEITKLKRNGGIEQAGKFI